MIDDSKQETDKNNTTNESSLETSTNNPFQLYFESEDRFESKKIYKVENLNEILNSSQDRISSFLHSCPDPKVWLLVIVSIF